MVGLRQSRRLKIEIGLPHDLVQRIQTEYMPENQLVDIDITMVAVLRMKVGRGVMLKELEKRSQKRRISQAPAT